MPVAGSRQVVTVTSALALLGATLALLIYTEPIAARFWVAVTVTAAIASATALLSRRGIFFEHCNILAGRARLPLLSREKSHDEHGAALIRSLLLFQRGDA
jgi:hypothetical protein